MAQLVHYFFFIVSKSKYQNILWVDSAVYQAFTEFAEIF